MRILIVSSKPEWGGVVSWMDHVCEGFRARGHEVWVACNPKSEFYARRHERPWMLPFRFGNDANLFAMWRLRRLIGLYRPELVIVNSAKEISIGGTAARAARVPVVRRIGMAHDVFRKPKYRLLHQRLVDLSIVPGEQVRQDILAALPGLNPASIVTIHNGREPTPPDPELRAKRRQELGLGPHDLVVGTISRLNVQKRHDLTLEAFARIRDMGVDAKLVLCGDGPELPALEAQSRALGIEAQVRFPGFVDQPASWLHALDLYVSNSEREGFSNSIVEAMAAGVPCVASDVEGVREIVSDGVDGFIVPFADVEACADRLSQLLRDAALREAFGAAARHKVEQGFSLRAMLDRLETTLQGVIDAHRR